MQIRRFLRNAIAKQTPVRIARSGARLANLAGYPLALGRHAALVRDVTDFALDGLSLLPIADLREVWTTDADRFADRVLRDRKALRHLAASRTTVPLDGWAGTFAILGAQGQLVMVESQRDNADGFDVGCVVGVTAEAVGLHCFTADARWESTPVVKPFAGITRVQFDTPYLNAFLPYLGHLPAS